MSARSQKPKNRRIRLVGGGFRWTRASNEGKSGGSAKSMRRALRKRGKDKTLTPESRRAAKEQVRQMLLAKNRKGA